MSIGVKVRKEANTVAVGRSGLIRPISSQSTCKVSLLRSSLSHQRKKEKSEGVSTDRTHYLVGWMVGSLSFFLSFFLLLLREVGILIQLLVHCCDDIFVLLQEHISLQFKCNCQTVVLRGKALAHIVYLALQMDRLDHLEPL